MTTELLANNYTTTLSGNGGSITAGATSFNIVGTLPAALQAAGQFRVIIDQEIMIVPGGQTGPGLAGVTRGAENTTPAAHNDGAIVAHVFTAAVISSVMTTSSPRFATTILTPSGGDDSAVAATAIAAGGLIVLGPGTFLWNTTVPALTRSLPTRIVGAGVGKTTIKLSSGAPRFLDFNKVAANDTFNDIEITDLTVDCNSIGGQHHVVLGTYVAGTVGFTNINVTNLAFRRIRTVNVPTDATLTINRLNVYIIIRVNVADTLCTVTDVVFEDCDFTHGGNIGVSIGGTTNDGSGNGNLFHDRIELTRVNHDTGVIPTGFYASENIQIGSKDTGGTVTIRDCHGFNSGDVGIAVLNGRYSQVEDCTVTDSWNAAFQAGNFNPSMPADQTHHFKSCHAKIVSLNPITGGALGSGFHIAGSPNQQLGRVILENCSWHYGATNTPQVALSVQNPVSSVEIVGDFHMNATAISHSLAGNYVGGLVQFTPPGKASFIVRGALRSNVAGAITLNAHTFQFQEFYSAGLTSSNYVLDVDTHYVNYGLTGVSANSYIGCLIGPGSILSAPLPIFRGKYRLVVESHASADTGPTGVWVNPYATSAQITIQPRLVFPDCDFSPFPSGSVGREMIINSALTGNGQGGAGKFPLVLYPRITLANNDDNFTKGAKSTWTTVSTGLTSAVTIPNESGWPQLVWFDVALTALTINRRSDNNAALTLTSPNTGPYTLQPGDGLYNAAAGSAITYHIMPIKAF